MSGNTAGRMEDTWDDEHDERLVRGGNFTTVATPPGENFTQAVRKKENTQDFLAQSRHSLRKSVAEIVRGIAATKPRIILGRENTRISFVADTTDNLKQTVAKAFQPFDDHTHGDITSVNVTPSDEPGKSIVRVIIPQKAYMARDTFQANAGRAEQGGGRSRFG